MADAQFSLKNPAETVQVSFDFGPLFVQSGEHITAATWTAVVSVGTDGNPSGILSGTGTFTDSATFHLITAGMNGTTYLIQCSATTSAGQTLMLTGTMQVSTTKNANRIQSKQDLADYCLRQLGGGVINIEVTNDQLEDAIDDAFHYYVEYHPDGIERDYLVHKVTGSTLTLQSVVGLSATSVISSLDGKTRANVVSIDSQANTIIIGHQLGFDKFQIGQQIMLQGQSTPLTTITGIVLGDTDLGYIDTPDPIVGVTKILNLSSIMGSSEYMFNVQYQIMMSEIQSITSQGTAYFYGVQQYLGHMDFIMKKEKDFRFNRRMNKLFVDINWQADIRVGDFIVAEVYKSVEGDTYPEIYSDIWLRRYATARIKKLWGTNTSKYDGMMLPGGVKFSGKQIYDDAVQEIKELESEVLYSTAPLNFWMG